MNIKLQYLYRDAANYKNYGEVIFFNSEERLIEDVQKLIYVNLIDGEYFYTDNWKLPDKHFQDWDSEIDLQWHEFLKVELTNEKPTDLLDRTFSNFIKGIEKS